MCQYLFTITVAVRIRQLDKLVHVRTKDRFNILMEMSAHILMICTSTENINALTHFLMTCHNSQIHAACKSETNVFIENLNWAGSN